MFAAGATAQGVDSDQQAATQQNQIDEIIVTASRRAEKLQDVSMAVSAIDPQDFTAVGLTNLDDIVGYTPGVSMDNFSGSPVAGRISIRGVGQGEEIASVVGIYLDSIPLSSNSPWGSGGAFAFDGLLGDIERVEFLKGPQGTLYGATSIGGAVKYVTRKPSLNEFKGHISTDFSSTKEGGFNKIYSGRISAPLIEDKLGFTITGFYEDNAGLVDRVEAGTGTLIKEDADNYEREGFSADLYYKITDQFDFRGRVLHQKAEYNGLSRVNIDPATKEQIYGSLANHEGLVFNSLENTVYSGVFEYQFDGATLTSTSSYVEDQLFNEGDSVSQFGFIVDTFFRTDGVTSTAVPISTDLGSEKFTQEIQLTSDSSDTWEWIVGLYYADETTFRINDQRAQPGDFILIVGQEPSDYQETAAFGNLTHYITPEFDVTLGARISRTEMEFTSASISDIPGFAGPPFTNTKKDTVDTWSLAARYRPSETLSLYARAASGFRPASANEFRSDGTFTLPLEVEADTLWSYEVGAKGNLAEGLFSYELALWYLDWDNFQTYLSLSPFVNGRGNASGGITGKGIEGSFTINPTENFSIISNFAYTDSTLNEDEPVLNGLAGQQVPYVPEWTFSSRARYDFVVGNDLDANIGLGLKYQGSSRSAFTDGGLSDPKLNIPTDSYVVVDASFGLAWDRFVLNFYGTNLFNEEAMASTFGNLSLGSYTAVPLTPRTIGASLSIDF